MKVLKWQQWAVLRDETVLVASCLRWEGTPTTTDPVWSKYMVPCTMYNFYTFHYTDHNLTSCVKIFWIMCQHVNCIRHWCALSQSQYRIGLKSTIYFWDRLLKSGPLYGQNGQRERRLRYRSESKFLYVAINVPTLLRPPLYLPFLTACKKNKKENKNNIIQ